MVEGEVVDLIVESGAVAGVVLADGGGVSGGGGGPDDGDVPARRDPHGRGDAAPPGGSGDEASVRLAERIAELGAAARTAEDRNAAAAGRADHRLGGGRDAAGGCGAGAVLVPFAAPACRQISCGDDRPRTPARMPSFAAICGAPPCTGAASRAWGRATARRSRTRWCASRTRRSHQVFLEPEGLDDDDGLPERHLHLAAGGGAGGLRAHHPRP